MRAQLLAEIVYRLKDFSFQVSPPSAQKFKSASPLFLASNMKLCGNGSKPTADNVPEPLDHFLRRLFGEILSQKGFGFHRNNDAARTAASLVDSVQKFRQAMEPAS